MRWHQALLTMAWLATWAGAVAAASADPGIVVHLRTLGDHEPTPVSDDTDDVPRLLDEGHAAMRALDFHLAAERYCRAARLDSVDGQYRLGRLLLQQRSVPQAQAQGYFMLGLAAQNGHAEAIQFFNEVRPGGAAPALRPMCLPQPEPVATGPEPVSHEVVKLYLDQLNLERRRWARLVQERAPHHGVDPRLAVSIVRAESNFNPLAVSPKNAQGLMQLIPATAKRFGVRNPLDPRQNIEGGLAYLGWLLARFDHDVVKASAAYNAGEAAVDRHQGVPPYPETQAYVARILGFYIATRHQPPPRPTGPVGKALRPRPRG